VTQNVEVVRIDEIDDDVVDLGRRAFGRRRSLYREYLEWKYLRNPYRTDPLIYVARDRDGHVVAMRGFYGARWSTPVGVVDIPCADDFAVARAHRTTGVATALMRFALADLPSRGVSCVVNASGSRITVLQSLAMGWTSILAVDPLDRPVSRSALGEGLAYVGFKTRPLRRSLAALDDAQGVTSTPDPDGLAALATSPLADGSVRHVRDAAFYRWRYANPQREYRFLLAESKGRLTGYLAIGRQRPRPDTLPLYVADWAGESAAICSELLGRAVELCGSDTIRVWAASVSEEERSQLERLGFEPAQHELRAQGMPCVLFRSSDPDDADRTTTIERSTWDVRLIDSMHG
jgi:GNAT superfamily N-acetyltransferase